MVVQKKERKLLVVLLVGLLVAGGVYVYGGKPGAVNETAAVEPKTEVVADGVTTEMIKVHVKGDVNQPGVYQLPADSRMIDAIQAAGGAKAGVDLDELNLAAMLTDGGEVVVGKAAAAAGSKQSAEGAAATADGKVNLNTATAEQLDQLPGIGSTRAKAIVEYREENGRFLKVDDLEKVPGFGVKLVDQVREKVTVQ